MKNFYSRIKFIYRYQDAAGYKNFGEIIFKAESELESVKELEESIRSNLFDYEFFYPYKLSIPLIHFDSWNRELDHDWYIFEGLELTQEEPTDQRTIMQFISDIKGFAKTIDVQKAGILTHHYNHRCP